jgi:hypothetical protein
MFGYSERPIYCFISDMSSEELTKGGVQVVHRCLGDDQRGHQSTTLPALPLTRSLLLSRTFWNSLAGPPSHPIISPGAHVRHPGWRMLCPSVRTSSARRARRPLHQPLPLHGGMDPLAAAHARGFPPKVVPCVRG